MYGISSQFSTLKPFFKPILNSQTNSQATISPCECDPQIFSQNVDQQQQCAAGRPPRDGEPPPRHLRHREEGVHREVQSQGSE